VRFLIDNQLPTTLARLLAERGAECHHVLDLGLGQAADSEIWRFAAEREMVVISKDEDFFHLAGIPGAGVQLVWVRLGNCRTGALLSALERAWPRIQACLEAGDRVVEVR
jgi:predicted nuclease of predicted toxin-antitoxin system